MSQSVRSVIVRAAAVLSSVAVICPAARAASPTVYLQNSMIVGSGGTLTISRLPFNNGTRIIYDDVTIPFSVQAGALVIGNLVAKPSQKLLTNGFVPGVYTTLGGKADATATVTGPGVGVGGSTVWSVAAKAPDSGTPITAVQWTVGPLSDNPTVQAYLKTYAITPDPNYSYGVGQAGGYSSTLVGFAQVGGTLNARVYAGANVSLNLTYALTAK